MEGLERSLSLLRAHTFAAKACAITHDHKAQHFLNETLYEIQKIESAFLVNVIDIDVAASEYMKNRRGEFMKKGKRESSMKIFKDGIYWLQNRMNK